MIPLMLLAIAGEFLVHLPPPFPPVRTPLPLVIPLWSYIYLLFQLDASFLLLCLLLPSASCSSSLCAHSTIPVAISFHLAPALPYPLHQLALNFVFLLPLSGHISSVEVHFEAPDSGFFLKHARQPPVTPEIANVQTSSSLPPAAKTRSSYDSVLSLDRFTVVETTQPVSIRASYGPFSTKQTVPARYIVPDTMDASGNQGDYVNVSIVGFPYPKLGKC